MRRSDFFLCCSVFIILSLIAPAVCWGQWTNWGQINQDGFGDSNNFSAFSMAVYGNQLYVGTWNNADGCQVWRRDGSGTGDWTQINTDGFGDSHNRGAHSMAVYNDRLYVGTANNTDGFEVWAYDGFSWTQVASGGLGDSSNTWASSMVVHDGKLYVGSSWQGGVFTYDGSTWTQINENGFGDSDNQAVRSLAVYDGKVYAGVYNHTDFANLYRYDGPTTSDWTLVTSGGFGDNFVEFRSLAAYDGKLFIGGAGWSISCQVWEYDGTIFTQNDPGAAMKYDAARCMTVFQDKLYVGTGNDSGVPSGGQVWEYDGTTWDQMNDNGFGDTDNDAVHSLASDGSSLFAGVANKAGAGGKVFASVQAPIVTTQAVTGIGLTTATGNGTITDLGYSNPTAHGVCWNSSGTPTTTDSHTDEGATAATGAFTSSMTGLSPGTTYYVRAYATNTEGTAYGNEVSFTTIDTDGIPTEEESGPDGTDPSYDGNGDGIPDNNQPNVGSFHTADGNDYVTLAAPDGTQLSGVEALPAPAPGTFSDLVSFPYGLFRFTINGVTPGGSVQVELILPAGASCDSYWKYGREPGNATVHPYKFTRTGGTGAQILGNTVVLYFIDGQRGDDDLDGGNGIIVDDGGPGSTTPVVPALSREGIIVFMILLSLLACWMIRRRKLFNEKMGNP